MTAPDQPEFGHRSTEVTLNDILAYAPIWNPEGAYSITAKPGNSGKAHSWREPTRDPIPPEKFERAFAGKLVLVGSPIGSEGCPWIAIDIDRATEEQIRIVPRVIADASLVPVEHILILRSGSPGSIHVFIVLDEPLPRRIAQRCAEAVADVLRDADLDVDKILPPDSEQSGIKLPGMAALKFGGVPEDEPIESGAVRWDQLLNPVTLEPVEDQMSVLVDPPLVDARRLAEAAEEILPRRPERNVPTEPDSDATYDRSDSNGLWACVRSLEKEEVSKPGSRNNRMVAIAAARRRRGERLPDLFERLMRFYDRCYRVENGTSREEHQEEARSIAERADNQSLRFSCKKVRQIDDELCKPECPIRVRAVFPPGGDGFPSYDPELLELLPSAFVVFRRHFERACLVGLGNPYFLRAEEAAYGLSPTTAREARYRLIEHGWIQEIAPKEIIEAGLDLPCEPRRGLKFYLLGPAFWRDRSLDYFLPLRFSGSDSDGESQDQVTDERGDA